MRKSFFLCLILFTGILSGYSQYSKGGIRDSNYIFLRLNLLGLLDIVEPNLSVGAEIRWKERWSYGADIGWVFYSNSVAEAKNINGIIIRPFMRYYITEKHRTFIEGELHYKYVVYQMEDWVGRGTVAGVPAFEEFMKFPIRKHVAGFNFKFGGQTSISANKKTWLEFYVGFGIRYRTYKVDIDERSNYTFEDALGVPFLDFDEGFTRAIPMGIRLLIRLR